MMLALLLLAAPYYDGDDPNPAPLGYDDATLTRTLQQELSRNRIGNVDVAKLSRVEKIAVLYLMGAKEGAEFDAIVEDKGQFYPVETQWNGEEVTFKVGAPRAQIYGKASSKEEIAKKYGVGPFVDSGAAWDNGSLYVVEQALSTLSKDELKGIAGLPFHRMPRDPSGKKVSGQAIAMYVPEKQQIELYDGGLEADKRKFFGSVDKPMPLTSATIIHEAGHAISRRASRDARTKIEVAKKEYEAINDKLTELKKKYDEDKATYMKSKDPALGKELNERAKSFQPMIAERSKKQQEFEQLAAQMTKTERMGSDLERALQAKLPLRDAPTAYARTSIAEAFAECLAIYKTDKKALERAAPAAAAWFDSAEYTSLVK